jgi:DNA mismatch repair ATPase MutS
MAGFKETFTKGLTTINMKTSNFMEESKLKTYISSLENEVHALEQGLGRTVYEKWKSGAEYKEGMEEVLTEIQSKYDAIEEQKKNIEKLHEEERQVLGSSQASAGAQQAAPSGIFCPACGAPNDPSYKFCCKCGSPLT